MPREKVIGIVVKKGKQDIPDYEENMLERTYILKIGYREKGSDFITTPAIRERINKIRAGEGKVTGTVDILVRHEFKDIIMYPFYHPFLITREMQGVGLANLLDLLLEKKLKKEYPGYKTRISNEAENARKNQLRKRKRDPRKTITLEEAFELTRRKVILDAKRRQSSREGVKKTMRRIREGLKRKKVRYF